MLGIVRGVRDQLPGCAAPMAQKRAASGSPTRQRSPVSVRKGTPWHHLFGSAISSRARVTIWCRMGDDMAGSDDVPRVTVSLSWKPTKPDTRHPPAPRRIGIETSLPDAREQNCRAQIPLRHGDSHATWGRANGLRRSCRCCLPGSGLRRIAPRPGMANAFSLHRFLPRRDLDQSTMTAAHRALIAGDAGW